MDRRKFKSKAPLHKNLSSGSQLSTRSHSNVNDIASQSSTSSCFSMRTPNLKKNFESDGSPKKSGISAVKKKSNSSALLSLIPEKKPSSSKVTTSNVQDDSEDDLEIPLRKKYTTKSKTSSEKKTKKSNVNQLDDNAESDASPVKSKSHYLRSSLDKSTSNISTDSPVSPMKKKKKGGNSSLLASNTARDTEEDAELIQSESDEDIENVLSSRTKKKKNTFVPDYTSTQAKTSGKHEISQSASESNIQIGRTKKKRKASENLEKSEFHRRSVATKGVTAERTQSKSQTISDDSETSSEKDLPVKKKKLSDSRALKNVQESTSCSGALERNVFNISQQHSFSPAHKSPIKSQSTSVFQEKNSTAESPDSAKQHKKITDKVALSTKGHCVSKNLQNFLKACGITITPMGSFSINEEPLTIKKNIEKLLDSGQYGKAQIISSIEKYIQDDENMQNVLNDIEMPGDQETFLNLFTVSLSRLMLQVLELQTGIRECLFDKLMESLHLSDSVEKVSWRLLVLQQIRFLEVITDATALLNSIEQLLESCPTTFQKELIILLPDILPDSQHHGIADILSRLIEEEPELISVTLDCIAKLTLGKEYFEEYRKKVLHLLHTNVNRNQIPDIVKFVFNDCPNADAMKNTICELRKIELEPLAGEKLEECFENQVNIMHALKINILLSKDMVQSALAVIKDVANEPKPIDVIFLLLIFLTHSAKRKPVEAIFKMHIRSGFYRRSLLNTFYNDFKEVTRELQPAAIIIASNLLKADDHVFFEFGNEWFRLQFLSQVDAIHKQREIIERITLLMGNNDQTAKNALRILCNMVANVEEKQALQMHCNHLRILLEKMDNFDLEEVGILCDVLYSLCTGSNSASDSLYDDLNILLQKQLSNAKPFIKCKGVLGAVMAIKHLVTTAQNFNGAQKLFGKVLTSVKNCTRSRALFYDNLAQLIEQTADIDNKFIEYIRTYMEDEFIQTHMIDKSTYDGEMVSQFGLNDPNEETENNVIHFGNERYGAIVPISFRLLKACCMRLSDNCDLESIDALLGTAILLPPDFDSIEYSVTDLLIHCINWFRELISGFVTQEDSFLQTLVLKRLDNLMTLQTMLSTALPLCDAKYQPPVCYFHYLPIPPFLRAEKRLPKKGKKDSPKKNVTVSNVESWEAGSAICLKNPAYFRKLDAKIVHLLHAKMEMQHSQAVPRHTSVTQVCFIIKELLGILDNEPSESFIRDVIHLLPKICSKLQDIVAEVKAEDNNQNKEAIRLLLSFLATVFNWKGFHSATHQMLLRDGLRTLASQISKDKAMLRSCRELVAESYKFFESLEEIASQISLAVGIVNVCKVLMKHSRSYTEQNKDKQAKMAFGFLCLEWLEDKHFGTVYKSAITELLNNWIDNELSPLDTVKTILEWLPGEVATLAKPQDNLTRIPSISKTYFHLFYKKLFDGVINGIKISLSSADTDPMRITVWQNAASVVHKLAEICKTVQKRCLLLYLRYMPTVLKLFINSGMPVLEQNLKYQTDDITGILKAMQGGTRYLHAVCCHSGQNKDVTLTKYVPAAKAVLEQLLYSVKGMLVLNNSPAAFWMGNLRNKNLDGQEILSQTSSEANEPDLEVPTDDGTNVSSDVLNSDSDSELDEDDIDDS